MKTFEQFLQIILAAVESLAHSVSARIGAGRTKAAWSVTTVLVASLSVPASDAGAAVAPGSLDGSALAHREVASLAYGGYTAGYMETSASPSCLDLVSTGTSASLVAAGCAGEWAQAAWHTAVCGVGFTAFGAALRGWRAVRAVRSALSVGKKGIARAIGTAAAGGCGVALVEIGDAIRCLAADSECPGNCDQGDEQARGVRMRQQVQSHLDYIEAGLAELDADDGVEW